MITKLKCSLNMMDTVWYDENADEKAASEIASLFFSFAPYRNSQI